MDRFYRALGMAAKPILYLSADCFCWTIDGAMAAFRMDINYAE
jgi:hypothetical protein